MPVVTVWEELERVTDRPAFRRVDELHPWDLYAIVGAAGEHGLMLVTDEEPPALPQYDTLDLACNCRADGRWALVIRLLRPELTTIFGHLCDDLVGAARGRPIAPGQAQFLLTRLARWRRLMDSSSRGLSEEELRGLAGELIFLQRVAIPEWGASTAIPGWCGPLGAPQDFDLPGRMVEVKTVRPGAPRVTISSVDQLDTGTAPLLLCVISLGTGSVGVPDDFTVGGIVESVHSTLDSDPVLDSDFTSRLAATGFNPDLDQARALFSVRDLRFFSVGDGFPRLTASAVPRGITGVRYQIDIAYCGGFEVWSVTGSKSHAES